MDAKAPCRTRNQEAHECYGLTKSHESTAVCPGRTRMTVCFSHACIDYDFFYLFEASASPQQMHI